MATCANGQIIAAGSLEIPTIVATGKTEITVEPDYALISVHFSKTDKNLQAAQKASENGVAKVLELSRRYSIPPADVSTDAISVSMKYLSVREASVFLMTAVMRLDRRRSMVMRCLGQFL